MTEKEVSFLQKSLDKLLESYEETKTQMIKMQTTVNSMEGKIDKMCSTINGNGKIGLVMEVDRLKEREKIKSYLIGTVFVMCMGLAARFVYEILMKVR